MNAIQIAVLMTIWAFSAIGAVVFMRGAAAVNEQYDWIEQTKNGIAKF